MLGFGATGGLGLTGDGSPTACRLSASPLIPTIPDSDSKLSDLSSDSDSCRFITGLTLDGDVTEAEPVEEEVSMADPVGLKKWISWVRRLSRSCRRS